MKRIASLLSAALLAATLPLACTPGGEPNEQVGAVESPVFVNGGFETGTANVAPPTPWVVQSFLNPGITVQTPQTRAGLNLAAGGNLLTTILSGTNQADPDLGILASLRYCRYGMQCARVNFHSSSNYGNGRNVNSLSQSMVIAAGDVDPADGQIHVRAAIAPVLQNPGHTANQQPYYMVQVTNVTTGVLLYSDFNLSAQSGVPWKTINGGTANEINYVDWSLLDVPGGTGISIGDTVNLEIIASGCQPNGHFGEVYVDGVGSTVPGLFTSGVAPVQANAGSLVSYVISYKNGSGATATGIVVSFTTPPNTTFQSYTPPAGALCTTPLVGSAGTITCALSTSLAAGATGSYQVSVNLSGSATGFLIAGTYDVRSNEETAFIGSKMTTTIGCANDAICGAGKWCNISGNQCLPTLVNGTVVPSDPPHTNPTLNGACTAGAGSLVCASAVCDAIDNKCGKLNASGPCTTTNQATICRSGVCDADGSCGYTTNHGPCSVANQATVCRSGSCSNNLLCQPAGGCNVDADCTGGQWCNETAHTCTAKLTNGTNIPTDTPHANPTLNGTCAAAAATLVCQAAVCDASDNKCGYATNGGPCSAANQAVVCRSGSCSANLLCRPSAGCNVDADCTGGQWCNEAQHVCTAKLANGTSIPSDPPHTSPTLNGVCSAAAATLVCQATVCDSIDDKCGKLNGSGTCTVANQATICRSGVCDANDGACGYATNHGPCSIVNAATVCRSGSCSSNLLCQPSGGCNVDADCTGGQWCNETAHTCTAKLTNGTNIPTDTPHANPTLNGTCAAAAATLVCQSTVCDSADDKCGYGTNGGPCTTANQAVVCRSGSCSSNALCKPVGGCNVDSDCTAGNWCNEVMHACTPTLSNGSPLPSDPPHTSPTLDGACTVAAGTLVCTSAVCDADNLCGYAVGHGPCTAANGAVLCRSGACSVDGTCRPSAGCNLDADCSGGNWCEISTRSCKSKLANGTDLPSDAPHTSPKLDGKCTAAAATLVCQSAVCDSGDDQCGYAVGSGPCTAANGANVCRSGECSSNGLCQPADGCNVDADCGAGKWCNEGTNVCRLQLDNGTDIPVDGPHVNPELDGKCTEDAGALVCLSGVCDTKDDRCGLSNGVGPCTQATAASVCRSGLCGSNKLCVGCSKDGDCSAGTPICNLTTGLCGECSDSTQCSGTKPICDAAQASCVACNGDFGSKTSHRCEVAAAPVCFGTGSKLGQCGTCSKDADCAGHTGTVCETASGACVSGCTRDSDCSTDQWCDDGAARCVTKLDNGKPLPSEPTRVAQCTTAVGAAVCASGVCDASDDTCGYAPGSGPCADPDQCRSASCDEDTKTCRGGACSSDADCSKKEYCGDDGTCKLLLPTGSTCSSSSQCQTHDCYKRVCSSLVAQGQGVACALRPGARSNGAGLGALMGLALMGLAWQRRRRAA